MHGASGARMAPRDGRPKQQRSSYYDVDVLEWLADRGKRMDRSIDWQIREILREKMDAELDATQAGRGAEGRAG